MLIADMDRAYGGDAGTELVERLGDLRRQGGAERVIGIGADSTELGVDMREFAPAFELARGMGLRRTCHAGEAVGVGPDNIRLALDELGAERIDHGVAVMEDADLVRRLASEGVPLTVCPTSNVVIANRYASLAEHPLPAMLEAGLLVTINTDDPAMTDLDLGREYRAVADAHGMSVAAMAELALEGIESTWLDAADRSALRREFQATIDDVLEVG